MSVKKVCVLGGSGFVGSPIVTHLNNAGYQVKVLSRRHDTAKHLSVLPNVSVVECNMLHEGALSEHLKDCHAVINLIGILFESKRNTFEAVHHQLPRRLAHVCEEIGVPRLIQISALNANKNAASLYLRSKAAGEEAINEFNKKINITIFRPSVIFGRGDHFLNLFAGLIKNLPIIALAESKAKLQPIWVEDVACAIVNSVENTMTYGKTYELGGPKVYTMRELMQKVMHVIKIKRTIIPLSHTLGYLQACFMELLPVKLLSRDNLRSMQEDNICKNAFPAELGVNPTPLDTVIPEYLTNKSHRANYDVYRSIAGRTEQRYQNVYK